MMRLKAEILFVCILCLITFVSSGKSNKEAFKAMRELHEDVESVISEGNDLIETIDTLEEYFNEQIENVTMGAYENDAEPISENNVVEDTKEPEADPKGRTGKLFDNLKRVESKMNLIKRFIAQEALMDKLLAGLDKKLKNDFVVVKGTVDEKTARVGEDVEAQVEDVKTTLESVNQYARSRNRDVAGAIYHGGMGSPCIAGNDECCLLNSSCHHGICQCDPGFSYDALHRQCVDECRFYGNTFQTIPKYILRGFNSDVLNETTIYDCKAACLESGDCRSVEYFPRWHQCFLSDAANSNETEEAWEYNSAGVHYQRDCAYY